MQTSKPSITSLLAYSVVYFDIRGDYQLCYLYLACLSVEHKSNTTGTLRIGTAILEKHQVLFRLQSQQPHDLHTCGSLYVQQAGPYPSTSMDYMTSPMQNSGHTGHHKPTPTGRGSKHNHHWGQTHFWWWWSYSIRNTSYFVTTRYWGHSPTPQSRQRLHTRCDKPANVMGTDSRGMMQSKRVGCLMLP